MDRENKTNGNQIVEDATRKFFQELSKVRKIRKCKTCVCFCEIIIDLSKVLSMIDENRLQKIRCEVAEWMAECEKSELHGCLGCDPCLPVEPFKEFHQTLRLVRGIRRWDGFARTLRKEERSL